MSFLKSTSGDLGQCWVPRLGIDDFWMPLLYSQRERGGGDMIKESSWPCREAERNGG